MFWQDFREHHSSIDTVARRSYATDSGRGERHQKGERAAGHNALSTGSFHRALAFCRQQGPRAGFRAAVDIRGNTGGALWLAGLSRRVISRGVAEPI